MNAKQERLIELWAAGKTIREIAADIETTPGTVGVMMNRLRAKGIDVAYRRGCTPGISDDLGNYLRERYEAGESLLSLERESEYDYKNIRAAIVAAGGTIRTRTEAQQIRYQRAKVTTADD